jgi:hypothetical protein
VPSQIKPDHHKFGAHHIERHYPHRKQDLKLKRFASQRPSKPGGLGASAGCAGTIKEASRVTFWGALAMAATAVVGMIFG